MQKMVGELQKKLSEKSQGIEKMVREVKELNAQNSHGKVKELIKICQKNVRKLKKKKWS